MFNLFRANIPTVLWLALLLISLILPWVIFNCVGWVICLLDLITLPPPLVIKNAQRISVSGQVWCKQLLICQLGERILEMKAIKRKLVRKWLSAQKKMTKRWLVMSSIFCVVAPSCGWIWNVFLDFSKSKITFRYIYHGSLYIASKIKKKEKNGNNSSGCFADLFIKKWHSIISLYTVPQCSG